MEEHHLYSGLRTCFGWLGRGLERRGRRLLRLERSLPIWGKTAGLLLVLVTLTLAAITWRAFEEDRERVTDAFMERGLVTARGVQATLYRREQFMLPEKLQYSLDSLLRLYPSHSGP